jgi:hypothetical protein
VGDVAEDAKDLELLADMFKGEKAGWKGVEEGGVRSWTPFWQLVLFEALGSLSCVVCIDVEVSILGR